MKKWTVLGVDPGIANTGIAIVRGDTRYTLVESVHVTTDASNPRGDRLNEIYEAILRVLLETAVDAIAIEQCFHNKNISSSASTQQVIGLVHWMSFVAEIPVLALTPQKIKAACGLGGRAKKNEMLRAAQAMLRDSLENHHLVDAAFAAIAGILHLRSERSEMDVEGAQKSITPS